MNVATIGYFDGVHLGHQRLINKVVELAEKGNLTPAVYTFNSFGNNGKTNELIMTRGEKVRAIKELGVKNITTLIFNSVKNQSKEEFLARIKSECRVLVVGEDFRFGRNREGDVKYLMRNQDDNFKVIVMEDVMIEGEKISSTLIRNLIKNGELKKANSLLYENFQMEGEVVRGFGRGRTFGYKTANLELPKNLIRPKYGVYLSKVEVDDFSGFGMTMIGVAETFGTRFSCETNIFDFDKEIYGRKMKLEIVDFLRENKAMDSIESLKKQLMQDKKKCMKIIEEDFTF